MNSRRIRAAVKECAKSCFLHSFLAKPLCLTRLSQAVWLARFAAWRRAHPCPTFVWREPLYQHLLVAETLAGAVDYLEFGVFEGKTLKWWIEHNKDPQSRFVGFDTFTGLPEKWEWAPAGHFSTGGETPQINDARCSFQVGLFQQTLPLFLQGYKPGDRKVIHLDADLYSATLFVLMTMAPFLKAGDILIFDEFMWFMHEFRAFHDFLEAWPTKYEVVGASEDYAQVAIEIVER